MKIGLSGSLEVRQDDTDSFYCAVSYDARTIYFENMALTQVLEVFSHSVATLTAPKGKLLWVMTDCGAVMTLVVCPILGMKTEHASAVIMKLEWEAMLSWLKNLKPSS